MNAVEIEQAITDLADQPFDSAEFPFAFLQAFGNKETTLKRLRKGESNKSDCGGVLQTNNIHIAVATPGEVPAKLSQLKASPATVRAKAKFVLATDGDIVEAEDLISGETVACSYADVPNHFGFFLALAGITTVKQIRESAFDIRATSRLNKLYIELLNDNPDWGTAERRPDMNHFMARLVFCFFAEATDIFDRNSLFTNTVAQMSARDSSNTHEVISEVFRAMMTKGSARCLARLPRWADAFPFVNGGLFSDGTTVPHFSRIARSYLLHIGSLDWRKINPDIFGSMIQAVADDEERGSLGMHYTSVPNILKVLNPLFLSDLRNSLEDAASNPRKLLNLRGRIARIRVFDPACGSGNFLVIAYKQMREIEAEINRRRCESDRRSEIPLTNFRGIELRHFPAEIARLALIIAEYQCDVTYRGQKEALAAFLPLNAQNWIVCGNALRLNWISICPPNGTGVKHQADDLFHSPLDQAQIDFENSGGETYICGNPPYLGAKKKSEAQSSDMAFVGLGELQLLDYVAAFIVKGLDVIQESKCGMALVSTSSICQGEQVSLLWPLILAKATVKFAYSPFKWMNSAARNAGVWCTIIGFSHSLVKQKQLFVEDKVQLCDNISPYLIPGKNIYCTPASSSLSRLPRMEMGSNAVDGKNLVLGRNAVNRLLAESPEARDYIRRYGGTKEMLSGIHRWCIWIDDIDLPNAEKIKPIKKIIDNCKTYREGAGRDAKKAARRPHAFCYSTVKFENFIHIGNTIGNTLMFVPAELKESGYVSNHNAFTIYDVDLTVFSVIVSNLHRLWAETVSGRLGNGTRYGSTVVYNTFPLPVLTAKNKTDLARCAKNILLTREAHFPATINDLYASNKMPSDLCAAHERNDETLERIYIGRYFKNDTERLETLFNMYVELSQKSPSPGDPPPQRSAADSGGNE